jgi:hypothetical protein
MTNHEFTEIFQGNSDCEMTSRLIPGDENFDYPEWSETGTLSTTGKKVVLYYRTTPEDKKMVEENGGDWGDVDWVARMDRVEECDESGCPFMVLYNF